MSRTVLLSKLRSAGCSEPLAPSFLTREAEGAECRSRVAYRETTAELRALTGFPYQVNSRSPAQLHPARVARTESGSRREKAESRR